jgi:hypothetical protein
MANKKPSIRRKKTAEKRFRPSAVLVGRFRGEQPPLTTQSAILEMGSLQSLLPVLPPMPHNCMT